jgi:hypothetical protein
MLSSANHHYTNHFLIHPLKISYYITEEYRTDRFELDSDEHAAILVVIEAGQMPVAASQL